MGNHRIVRWRPNAWQGEIVVGGKGPGNRIDQLSEPVAVLIDRTDGSLIISEGGNRRVSRWSLDGHGGGEKNGKVIIADIVSSGLVLDDEGSLYVSDWEKHEVRRYGRGDRRGGVIVAGGQWSRHCSQ